MEIIIITGLLTIGTAIVSLDDSSGVTRILTIFGAGWFLFLVYVYLGL